ncbi:hypothetical protein [Microvirga terrestris]|uniref:Uncharacterized protein n=1 Tax=Microvirga terrestris TaxID=2791024 RepID=A0ABS0HV10_9HYPH|nr:hypothetical protein [Microvirga terrestris]MBF9197338.1 hypothetical protein [Microvirga terrestris]
MGQNEAAHLHDASVVSGPLWCVPVAAGIIAVWHNLTPEFEIVGLEGGAGLLTQIERHRIFSPQFSKNFYTISGHGLQDGRRLRVFLRGDDGADVEQTLDLRLAHWQTEGASQIVSSIVSRILSKHSASGDHGTLERFLSLVSSWRSSGRLKAQIGSHCLYELDIASHHFAQRQACFVLRQGRLTREVLDSVSDNGSSIFRISKGYPDRVYVDLDGDLVELGLSGNPVAEQHTVGWLQCLSPPAKNSLLDCLSKVSEAEPADLPTYVTASLKSVAFPLGEPHSEVAIEGCFQASGALFAFLKVTGTTALEDVQLELFGEVVNERREPNLLTCSTSSANGLPKSLIVAKASLDGGRVSACKVTLQVEGRSIQHWIQVQQGCTGSSLAFARSFWPLSNEDVNYLAEVGAPFASAWMQRTVKEAARTLRLTARQNTGTAVDLHVIAEARPELLHGTLIGFRASVPRGQTIRVTLRSSPGIEATCSSVIEWARRYDLDGELQVLPADAPASAAASIGRRSPAEVSIAVRAGFIPPRAGWLDEIVEQVAQAPDTFLLGVAPGRVSTRIALDQLDPETLLDLLAHDAVVAMAAPVNLIGRIPVERPVCHTVAGSWIERMIKGFEYGANTVPHAALGFLEINGSWDQDRFGIGIDEIALSRKIGATEHREMPINPTNVRSA